MTDPTYIIIGTLLALFTLIVLFIVRRPGLDPSSIKARFDSLEKGLERVERSMNEQISRIREDAVSDARKTREEMAGSLGAMRETLEKRFIALQADSGRRLDQIRVDSGIRSEQQRREITAALKAFNDSNLKGITGVASLQKGQLETFSSQLAKLTESNEKKMESLRAAIDEKLKLIQEDNNKQLNRIRETVDEKLQGTLEKRLGESFRHVSERLELVHKGLGEMQTLATGVGDLKRVLTNVKTRGGWGEVQLEMLLEQMLTPDQYEKNVKVDENSDEMVEFAIRLPGGGNGDNRPVLLPIDSKFPLEDYQRLVEAQEKSNMDTAEKSARMLESRIKSCAREISEKYLSPPRTTHFGIMFLPTEGLYAEVLRRPGLVDNLQRDWRVVIAGPTTFAALLNSLQMGFRTLAVQKRSSEVWELLGSVKKEFGKFGDVLEGIKKKLEQASTHMDKAATRSRAIERRLRHVQDLPDEEASGLLRKKAGQLKE